MTSSSTISPASDFPTEEELRPQIDSATGIDLSLIDENLKLTPWERILANDDTINFIDSARTALHDLVAVQHLKAIRSKQSH